MSNISRSRRWGLLLGALGLLLLAAVSWKAVRLWDATTRLQQEATGTAAIVGALQKEPTSAAPLVALGPALGRSSAALTALQAEVQPLEPLLRATRPLPGQIGWLADLPDLLSLATPLAQAGAMVVLPFSEAAQSAASAPRQDQLGLYLAAAVGLAPRMPELAARLDAAEAALVRLRGRQLGGPLRPATPFLAQGSDLLPSARQGLELLSALGPALGMERPRSYLLLGQNNAEIRATGGFIGSVGIVTLDKGVVTRMEYGSSYLPDEKVVPPPPPQPMARYLGLGGWYLRDANWWPDFPSSAAQVEQAWLRAGRDPIDGVIAIDATAVTALLSIVGPIQVPGYGSVSADGFERAAADQLYSRAALASPADFHHAKSAFFGAASHALMDRLLNLSPADLLPVQRELQQLLREKHLQLAFKDRPLLQVAHANGWDGSIPSTDEDSLYVVDTTVSYGDTYPFVDTEASLTINVAEDGSQQHELVLDYINNYPRGLPSWMPPAMVGGETFDPSTGKLTVVPGFWGNWLRVYLPPDARVTGVEGLVDGPSPTLEFGRAMVAGYLPVEPGRRRSVRLRYVTGAGRRQDRDPYRLFLQKQAGLEGRKISVVVTWPDGSSTAYGGRPVEDLQILLRSNDARGGNGASK